MAGSRWRSSKARQHRRTASPLRSAEARPIMGGARPRPFSPEHRLTINALTPLGLVRILRTNPMVYRHRPRGAAALSSGSESSRAEAGRQIQLVGRRLRRLRKDHRLTVPELAAAAGLQAADLARLEKG